VGLIYTFHMPLFLIISGFFSNITNINPTESLNRLTSRLIVPYLIFTSLYLLGLILIKHASIQTSTIAPSSISDYMEIITLRPRGAYWFIHSLFLIQLCFISARFISKYAKLDNATFFIISIALLAGLCHFNIIGQRTVSYFVIGFVFRVVPKELPASALTGILVMCVIFMLAGDYIYEFSILQAAWCLSILTFLAGAGKVLYYSRVVAIFVWLGRNSMCVLVLHAIFVVALKPTSSSFLKMDSSGLFYSFVVLISTIFGCLAAATALDKIRLSKYIFGVDNIYSRFEPRPAPMK